MEVTLLDVKLCVTGGFRVSARLELTLLQIPVRRRKHLEFCRLSGSLFSFCSDRKDLHTVPMYSLHPSCSWWFCSSI